MNDGDISTAMRHLKRDVRLAPVIARTGTPTLARGKNAFEALAHSIIYQQISGKAAAAILRKFIALSPTRSFPTPELVYSIEERHLRSAGISPQKCVYLRDLAEKYRDGVVNPRQFTHMSDEDIRTHLTAIKGIGRWTADMFLIFHLNRPDVLPTGDLGIQKGFRIVCNTRGLPTPKRMEVLARPWRPYRSVASWYLWRVADEVNSYQ